MQPKPVRWRKLARQASSHMPQSARQAIRVGAVHSRNHGQGVDIVRFQQRCAASRAVMSNYKSRFIDDGMSGPSDAAQAIKSCPKAGDTRGQLLKNQYEKQVSFLSAPRNR
ncbi:uncharacterized protein TrAtP1_011627 [Trichoderma atroviride]|uniref:uncharacterized protein n=1 Tax=Hypocrea atroviridis TaxID=63577 RepID=UPI00332A55AC|nr:hypothetical protein TrAtP1_011627 [Trichoderma atroviride]